MFNNITAQDKAIEIIKNAIFKDKVANSYLFYGKDGVGKFTTALYFGMALNCTAPNNGLPCGKCNSCKKFLDLSHPDLLYIFPTPKLDITEQGMIKSESLRKEYQAYLENKKHTPWKKFYFSKSTGIQIDSIRMLEHKIILSPLEAKYKIFIIEDAHNMNVNTQNAFLKTLEEPPENTILILTTSKPQNLLPTILSRCQKIAFNPVPENAIKRELLKNPDLDDVSANIISKISNGSMEKALQLANQGFMEARKDADVFLDIIYEYNNENFFTFLKNFKSSAKNELLIELINFLIVWIYDVSNVMNNRNNVINVDKIPMLKDFYNLNPNIEIYSAKIINKLEELKYSLKGHVNQQLILFEMFFYLTEFFH